MHGSLRVSSKNWFLSAAGIVAGPVLLFLLSDATPADEPGGGTSRTTAVLTAVRPDRNAPREPADNSYCYVCHANYEHEEFVTDHQRVGVGCETCHGISEKHSGDEDGLTPPDIMFPRDRIFAGCMTCHKEQDFPLDRDHEAFFKAGMQTSKTCADCHAEKHRLKVRTRIWDKATGKLLSDDGVRMMYKDSPATTGVSSQAKAK